MGGEQWLVVVVVRADGRGRTCHYLGMFHLTEARHFYRGAGVVSFLPGVQVNNGYCDGITRYQRITDN